MAKKYSVWILTGLLVGVSLPAYAGYWDKKTDDAKTEAVEEVKETANNFAGKEQPVAVAAVEATSSVTTHTSAPAAVAKQAPVAPTPAAPTKDDLVQRSSKGIENQKAWISTLEKQLAGEKGKLAQMEAEHTKLYGGSSR